jgi:hypothetical protein
MNEIQRKIAAFINSKFGGFMKDRKILIAVGVVIFIVLSIISIYMSAWIMLYLFADGSPKNDFKLKMIGELRQYSALIMSAGFISFAFGILKLLVDTDGDGIPQVLQGDDKTPRRPDNGILIQQDRDKR